MEPNAKRIKTSPALLAFLKPLFLKTSKWCVVYLNVALDCDTPILEAISFTTYAYTGFREDEDGLQLFSAVKEFILDRISSHRSNWCQNCFYPTSNWWHPDPPTASGVDGISVWTAKSSGLLELQNIDNRVHRSKPMDIGFCVVFDYAKKTVMINTADTIGMPRVIPWGLFIPILEEEIERFRPASNN